MAQQAAITRDDPASDLVGLTPDHLSVMADHALASARIVALALP